MPGGGRGWGGCAEGGLHMSDVDGIAFERRKWED